MQSTADRVHAALDIPNEDFVGIFLYGSQNYGLDCEGSDIDTILIVRTSDKPKQELSTLVGKTKIYTLKYFLYRLRQGDLECYEILYTKYKIVNPVYVDLFETFVKDFSSCMNYERIKSALYKKLDEHLCHVLWMAQNKENARYNKKRLYWAVRVCNQLQRICDGEDFASSLRYRALSKYDVLKIKTTINYLSIKDLNVIYKSLIDFLHGLPRYSIEVLEQEEKCLSDFYIAITDNKL